MALLLTEDGWRTVRRHLRLYSPMIFYWVRILNKIALYCDFVLLNEIIVVSLQRKSQYNGIMDLNEIGQIIKEQRAVLGVNQRTVSELSGVAVNTLVAIERGEGNPQIATLQVILDTIGLQLDVKPKVMEYETR